MKNETKRKVATFISLDSDLSEWRDRQTRSFNFSKYVCDLVRADIKLNESPAQAIAKLKQLKEEVKLNKTRVEELTTLELAKELDVKEKLLAKEQEERDIELEASSLNQVNELMRSNEHYRDLANKVRKQMSVDSFDPKIKYQIWLELIKKEQKKQDAQAFI